MATELHDLPAIIEQARQEEREKARRALAPCIEKLRMEPRNQEPQAVADVLERFLASLNPDTPEGGSE